MLKQIIVLLAVLSIAGCNNSSTPDSSDNTSAGSASTTNGSGNGSNFFAGKNINYIVTTNAGGGYDAYARLIGKYLSGYLGAKNVVINNIPGAGHIVGTNTLWKSKPDGLTIGTFNAGLIYNQVIHRKTLQFDIAQFSWVGKAAGEARSLVISEQCPVQSFDELLASTETIKLASAGIGSASHMDTKLLAAAFDLNIEIIPGFEGNEGEMSMMRGEVCGQFGTTSSVLPFVESGYGHFILTVGGDIEGIPRANEYTNTPKARGIINLISSLTQLGRTTAAPPNMPEERLKQLQDAYMQVMQDPKFLAEAEQMKLPIESASGDEVKQLVLEALDQTPETEQVITNAVNAGG